MTYCLVISGGSVKGFGLLGAIECILEKYNISSFSSFFGTSIGSIIAYLLCIGYTPLEIIHKVHYFKVLYKVKTQIDIANIPTNKGIFNFEHILEELELMTLLKHHELFTFKSLYEYTGKELCCITYNYSLQKVEILHYTTTPELPCLTGLRMSSSIPFVFDRFIYNDNIYIDGGIVDNFPIQIALKFHKINIIGVVSTPTMDGTKTDKISTFISNLIFIPIVEITRSTIHKYSKYFKIYEIPINYHFLNFNLTITDIMEMFSDGYNICKSLIN